MKSYSNLSINDKMSLTADYKSRFVEWSLNRINEQVANGVMNDRLSALIQGKNETSIRNLLESFYLKSNGSYEDKVKQFETLSETKYDELLHINKVFENWQVALQKNPHYPLSHKILDEAIAISPNEVLSYLLNEGCAILSHIDVKGILNKNLFESVNSRQASLEIKDDPTYVLALAESISRSIQYTLNSINESETKNKTMKFLESLNNIYSIYKEGMDIIATQEYQALDLMYLFLKDAAPSYQFSIHRLNMHLKDPASFVQYGMLYLHNFILKHQKRLLYKFEMEKFTRLNNLMVTFSSAHPLTNVPQFEDVHYSFPKMYQMLDLLLECSQMLRMDLRNLVCKFLSIIRPMVDSYRLDYQRGHIRTGH